MFGKHIGQLTNTLSSLRTFVKLVGQFLDQRTEKVLERRAKELGPFIIALNELDSDTFKQPPEVTRRMRKLFAGRMRISKDKDRNGLTLRLKYARDARALKDAMHEFHTSCQHPDLLLRSALISLISAVECYLAQVIYTYYESIPNAMPEKDKVFSFSDLKKFESIQDARTYLIEKKVTDLMRGSFSDWVAFFKEGPHLSMSYLEPYMDILSETCERRNLLVHNAGIANSIYLAKVAPQLRQGIKNGATICLTEKYLFERIDYFELHSLLIAAELWKKLKEKDPSRSLGLIGLTYQHLLEGRWAVGQGIAFFVMNDKQASEESRLMSTMNYWLCRKRQGDWDSVKQEVATADFSAKGLRYQLALLSLTENSDEFFKVLPRAIQSKDISQKELSEFPIFEEMRRDVRMSHFANAVPKKQKKHRHSNLHPCAMPD